MITGKPKAWTKKTWKMNSNAAKTVIVEDVVQKAFKTFNEHPEVQLVLEIATRSRELEFNELPRYMGIATDVIAL